jgi:hypothetical protein
MGGYILRDDLFGFIRVKPSQHAVTMLESIERSQPQNGDIQHPRVYATPHHNASEDSRGDSEGRDFSNKGGSDSDDGSGGGKESGNTDEGAADDGNGSDPDAESADGNQSSPESMDDGWSRSGRGSEGA